MKYLLLVLFVFGFFGGVLGQNEKQQSIDFWKKVNEFDSDTAKIGFINDIEDRRSYLQNPKLAEEILNFALQAKTKIKEKRYKGLLYKIIMYTHLFKMDFSTTITYADSALLFLEGKDRQLPLFEKGQCFMYTGQTNEAKAIFNSLLNDKDLPSRSKFLIARLFAVSKIREGDYDSAYIFLDKMEQIYIKDKEEEYYAATLDVRTMLYTQNRHYDSALISLRKMEEYKIKTQGKDDLGRIYGNMGNIYRDYGKQDLAEEYYQKSLAIKEEYGGKDLGFTYHALSSLYRDKGENEKAISYLKQAISAYEKVEDLE